MRRTPFLAEWPFLVRPMIVLFFLGFLGFLVMLSRTGPAWAEEDLAPSGGLAGDITHRPLNGFGGFSSGEGFEEIDPGDEEGEDGFGSQGFDDGEVEPGDDATDQNQGFATGEISRE
ncbi:MAG: hypothetical protein HQL52_17400 [Magnetococcales bacterium]|nr:hypothetical protein [Magnetococcales bacterium]